MLIAVCLNIRVFFTVLLTSVGYGDIVPITTAGKETSRHANHIDGRLSDANVFSPQANCLPHFSVLLQVLYCYRI
jgi:hypothetical protein